MSYEKLWYTRVGQLCSQGALRPGPASATRKQQGPGWVSLYVCLILLVNDITGSPEVLSWFDYEIPPQPQVSEHLFPSWGASFVKSWDSESERHGRERCVTTAGLWWLEPVPLLVPSLLPDLGIWEATTDQPTPTAIPSLPWWQDPLNWN